MKAELHIADEGCTIGRLKAWLATLPPEMDATTIQSCVAGHPSSAKRVIAYRYRDGSGMGIVVNSMGTHMADDFCRKDTEAISILQ